jgi:hypothetical protein
MSHKTKPVTKTGRPSAFNENIADAICAQIAEGKSMRTVCKADDVPAMTTIFRWLREKPEFQQQYTRAKEWAADAMAEDALDIIDNGTNDWMEVHDKDGECVGWRVNGEAIQRSRLRFEGRKWLMGKLRPRKYGDALDLNHGVQPDGPLVALIRSIQGSALPIINSPLSRDSAND